MPRMTARHFLVRNYALFSIRRLIEPTDKAEDQTRTTRLSSKPAGQISFQRPFFLQGLRQQQNLDEDHQRNNTGPL